MMEDINDIEFNQMMKQNIYQLNKLYIDNNIKIKYDLDHEYCIDQIDYFDQEPIEIHDMVINNMSNKFVQKELMEKIENKIYHDLLNNCHIKDKVRLLAYRSPKANAWLQTQIGPDIGNKFSLNNEEYNMITRLHYGIDIISRNMKDEDLKCTKCDIINDYKGNHAYNCKNGTYNRTWRHDQINNELSKLIEEYTMNYKLEPRKMDDTEERPDIIINDQMKMIDDKYSKCYYDTMITSIYNKNNMKDVENNNFKIFNAGLAAEKYKFNKYLGKFDNYNDNGYRFYPLIMESTGGINKYMRHLINQIIRYKSISIKDFAIKIKNYYIQFSIKWIKIRYKSLYSHIA